MPPSDAPGPRQRLSESVSQYLSTLDVSHGPLRATSDGTLVKEETGDHVNLELPPRNHDVHKHAPRTGRKTTQVPILDLPEAENGGTGLDDPRKRRSLVRWFKDMWTRTK
jgi:hypothetical protein